MLRWTKHFFQNHPIIALVGIIIGLSSIGLTIHLSQSKATQDAKWENMDVQWYEWDQAQAEYQNRMLRHLHEHLHGISPHPPNLTPY